MCPPLPDNVGAARGNPRYHLTSAGSSQPLGIKLPGDRTATAAALVPLLRANPAAITCGTTAKVKPRQCLRLRKRLRSGFRRDRDRNLPAWEPLWTHLGFLSRDAMHRLLFSIKACNRNMLPPRCFGQAGSGCSCHLRGIKERILQLTGASNPDPSMEA